MYDSDAAGILDLLLNTAHAQPQHPMLLERPDLVSLWVAARDHAEDGLDESAVR